MAVQQTAFASARPVPMEAIAVKPEAIRSAPVVPVAAVAPAKESLVKPSPRSEDRATARCSQRPRGDRKTDASASTRAVCQKQQALAANAGRPLDVKQVQQIRQSQPAPARTAVRQVQVKTVAAPPRQPAEQLNRPASQVQQRSQSPAPAAAQQPPAQAPQVRQLAPSQSGQPQQKAAPPETKQPAPKPPEQAPQARRLAPSQSGQPQQKATPPETKQPAPKTPEQAPPGRKLAPSQSGQPAPKAAKPAPNKEQDKDKKKRSSTNASGLRQQRFQLLRHHHNRRAERYEQDRGKDQEEHWKYQFHPDFPRPLLSLLAKSRAQILGVRAQGGADADAKAVAIDQQIRQLAQFRLLIADG